MTAVREMLERVEALDAKAYIHDRVWFEPMSGCWLWKLSLDSNGYGYACWEMVRTTAHRFSWMVFRGPIPSGLIVDHLCRTPSCVNPDHLEPVRQGENVRRGNSQIGRGWALSGHPSAKLNEATVSEIREAAGSSSQRKLARRFGVSQSTVCRIHAGSLWPIERIAGEGR